MKLNIKSVKVSMARKKMNVADLAKALGCKRSTVDAYLSGRCNPSLKALGRISEALGVDVTEIIVN